MEQQTTKMPVEAILLYNDYIHGEISRREFIDGAKRLALTGVALTAITEGLMPNYALGQQVRKDDERIKATYETVQSPMAMEASRAISCARPVPIHVKQCRQSFPA